ncbi:MAG: toxin-antitoxin system protein [Acidobacteria bacterium]|nr:toxin-antitoxin system protein [Acidobacteriota bacterium]
MRATTENPNIRISPQAKATLRELAHKEGKPMQTVLDEAIEHYQREKFMDEVNAAYARLKSDPKEWREEQEERDAWEATDSDGLEDE